jgi:hypothetical protein
MALSCVPVDATPSHSLRLTTGRAVPVGQSRRLAPDDGCPVGIGQQHGGTTPPRAGALIGGGATGSASPRSAIVAHDSGRLYPEAIIFTTTAPCEGEK